MKTSIEHLPLHKQNELLEITEIIKKNFNSQKIILFGSYARGNWVEDVYVEDHITYEYKSDMDILLIVKKNGSARIRLWKVLEQAIHKNNNIQTPVNIIIHGIEEINKRLLEGHYFFSDIIKEGILLYDSGRSKFAEPRELTSSERKSIAEDNFQNWYESAVNFLNHFEFGFKNGTYKIAAFLMHQATERLYITLLLTFNQYKPKSHDIEMLGRLAIDLDPEFIKVFPLQTEFQTHCFKLLKRAYIDARYDKSYKIQKEELEYLQQRVALLKEMVKDACARKIMSFESAE